MCTCWEGRPSSAVLMIHNMVLFTLEIISCLRRACCRRVTPKTPLLPCTHPCSHFPPTNLWNNISDWWGMEQCLSNRLWFAPRALKRFPGHCPHDGFYFLSTWEHTGEARDHNICWIQMRRPSRWWQRSATVPQGALSPSGRGRATSASTWLDSPIKWHHEFCLMDFFFF